MPPVKAQKAVSVFKINTDRLTVPYKWKNLNRSYVKSIFLRVILKECIVNETDCVIHSSAANAEPGKYTHLRFEVPDSERKYAFKNQDIGSVSFSLQGIAWLAKGREIPPTALHLSHICGVPYCINPNHLVVEGPKENCARKNCVPVYKCQCGTLVKRCTHKPRCISPIFDKVREKPRPMWLKKALKLARDSPLKIPQKAWESIRQVKKSNKATSEELWRTWWQLPRKYYQ